MKKIPTIFNKSYRDGIVRVINMQNPFCNWVFLGEGVATRKFDGTCVMIKDGNYFKRRCIKMRKSGVIPAEFIEEQLDPNTGKLFGWMPVTGEDKWHMKINHTAYDDGTYELVGPKVQGNPEGYDRHVIVSHRWGKEYIGILRTFDGIREFMRDKDIEGIVFHHEDGRMAKIKKSDYRMKRKSE